MPRTGVRASSRRTRSARRAASPDLTLKRSWKAVNPPGEDIEHRTGIPIPAKHYGAGITKKTKKRGPLSSKKRRRQERGVGRGEMALDKLELKIAKSMGKSKVIKGRRINWEDLNSKVIAEQTNISKKAPEKSMQEIETLLDREVEMVVEGEESVQEPSDITKELEGVAKIKISAEEHEQEQEPPLQMQLAEELELDKIL
ncbi:MAG: TRAPP subunit trs31 [Watsoniomyces obsoletus]|nr:MAG: TRAPP subunit trs31 [Watsoniomyces obsoletus]